MRGMSSCAMPYPLDYLALATWRVLGGEATFVATPEVTRVAESRVRQAAAGVLTL